MNKDLYFYLIKIVTGFYFFQKNTNKDYNVNIYK